LASLRGDAIFFYTEHGWDNILSGFNPAITIADINGFPANELNQLRLAVLTACHTAGQFDHAGNPVAQNIANAIKSKGADAVLAFRGCVPLVDYDLFNERLWHYLTAEGMNVGGAAAYAVSQLPSRTPDPQCPAWGFTSWTVEGNMFEVIYPAAYGN